MQNCVECGAPLGRDGDPCETCGAATTAEPRNGTSHPLLEDPDGMIYEDSPLLRHDPTGGPRHHEHAEPPFAGAPLGDDPSVRTPAFASAPLVAEPVSRPAHFASRAVALGIDLVVLSVLDVVLLALATSAVLLAERLTGARVGGATELVRASVSAGSLTLFLGYFSVLHARSGQTLGKVAMRIHVRDRSGARFGVARSILRTCSYGLSALPLGLGFLIALGPAKRALHDRIAGTVVIRERSLP